MIAKSTVVLLLAAVHPSEIPPDWGVSLAYASSVFSGNSTIRRQHQVVVGIVLSPHLHPRKLVGALLALWRVMLMTLTEILTNQIVTINILPKARQGGDTPSGLNWWHIE